MWLTPHGVNHDLEGHSIPYPTFSFWSCESERSMYASNRKIHFHLESTFRTHSHTHSTHVYCEHKLTKGSYGLGVAAVRHHTVSLGENAMLYLAHTATVSPRQCLPSHQCALTQTQEMSVVFAQITGNFWIKRNIHLQSY